VSVWLAAFQIKAYKLIKAWRLMIKVMFREIAGFIRSGFGELKISEDRHEDLLSEADERYPKHLSYMKQVIYVSH
jgi:transcription initiation factor TFIID subunit TAF12